MKLGPYTLLRRLGAGGMGEVWQAQRTAVGGAAKQIALKTLLRERAGDETMRQMFLDEARLSMLLSNSNIVQVFDVDVAEDGTCYMAMEWVDGVDLAELSDRLRKLGEKLPVHVAAFIVGEVLKALAYAHEFNVDGQLRTIVHRDISPHNVMLSVNGEVKLTDFGIARLASEETSGLHIKGKLRYMAPEQLGGETRSPSIDLFAVGAVLHELLEGQKFRGEVLEQGRLYGVILGGEVTPLRDPEAVPVALRGLLDALLASKPEQRPANARVAYHQLAAWPGYRDAKFELEDIIRRVGQRSPNSSGRDEFATTLASGSAAVDPDATELGRTAFGTTEVAPRPTAPVREAKRFPAAAVGVAAIVLVAGVFGLGTVLGWWDRAPPASHSNVAAKHEQTSEPKPQAEVDAARVAELVALAERAYGAANYAGALQLYMEAQKLGAAPRILRDIARCHEALEDYAAAIDSLQTYLSTATAAEGKAPSDALDVERKIGQLHKLIAAATAESEPEAVEPEAQPKPSNKKIAVNIRSDPLWAQLKVGGEEHTIIRGKRTSIDIKLKPGSHTIRHRDKLGGSWYSNTIEVPKSGSLALRIRNGGKLEVM